MKALLNKGPIVACSSGLNENYAVGVIRCSGFESLDVFNKILSVDSKEIKHRIAFRTQIRDENQSIDDVLGIFFKAPHSYTGENVLELFVHGNQLNIKRILKLIVDNCDHDYATGGEFTYRALASGKLSLSQVEGLDLFLNAKTIHVLDNSLPILNGELQQEFEELRELYINTRSYLEMLIDFSEDVGEEEAKKLFYSSADKFIQLIKNLTYRTQFNTEALKTPRLTIFGPPNAGKSTFFNQLVKHERAMVSHIAGTTRDYIEELGEFGHFSFKLVDTAGLRETEDLLEKEGISRSDQMLQKSFFKILVLNPHLKEHVSFLQCCKEIPDLIIFSHADKSDISSSTRDTLFSILFEMKKGLDDLKIVEVAMKRDVFDGPIGPPVEKRAGPIGPGIQNNYYFGPIGPLEWKEKKAGPIGPLDQLNFCVFQMMKEKYDAKWELNPIMVDRHSQILKKLDRISRELSLSLSSEDLGLVSHMINSFDVLISELIGNVQIDEIYENIFGNFCIGK